MDDIIKKNGGNSNIVNLTSYYDKLRQSLTKLQQEIPAKGFDAYLRLARDGKWIYGQEGVEVEPGSKWGLDLDSVQHGYVCWARNDGDDRRSSNSGKLGEVMVPHHMDLPDRMSLKDHGFPWKEQISFKLGCISGEDTGTQTQYAVTSIGGLREVKEKLLPTIIRALLEEEEKGIEDRLVPVVQLEASFYNHREFGKIYTPVIKFIGFVSPGKRKPAPETVVEAEVMSEPEEAPRRRRPRV